MNGSAYYDTVYESNRFKIIYIQEDRVQKSSYEKAPQKNVNMNVH